MAPPPPSQFGPFNAETHEEALVTFVGSSPAYKALLSRFPSLSADDRTLSCLTDYLLTYAGFVAGDKDSRTSIKELGETAEGFKEVLKQNTIGEAEAQQIMRTLSQCADGYLKEKLGFAVNRGQNAG